jgi:hypothetical protein
MEVDATNTTLPFKKLTDDERAQYRAEGRCFRCRTQGHMARNCPKNTNRNPVARTTDSTTSTATTDIATNVVVTPPPKPTLTIAQQIRALENRMTEEERGAYLDARDMGTDFCSAEL